MIDGVKAISDGYRRLALGTLVATLALIVVGGVVRVSDSGLGCGPAGAGIEGWPFCGGRVVPIIDTNMIIEYTHRALASAVGLALILLTAIAWRSYRSNRPVLHLSTCALLLVVAEGLLGGLVVEHGLHPTLVAIHLGISMIIAGLLLLLVVKCRPQTSPENDAAPSPFIRVLALAAPLLTWSTIVIGGYVAGTQRYGSPEHGYSIGAHMACSDQFPRCLGGWWPWGASSNVDAQLTHRLFMYLTAIAVVWLAILAWRVARSSTTRKLAIATVLVLGAQILLGAMNVWYGEHRGMILAHLALGTALWMIVLPLGYLSAKRAKPGPPTTAVESSRSTDPAPAREPVRSG